MRAATPDELLLMVGRRIAELRRRADLTQEAFAELNGVSVKYLQRIERGRENLTLRSLFAIATQLETKIVDLFVEPVSLDVVVGRPRKHDRSD